MKHLFVLLIALSSGVPAFAQKATPPGITPVKKTGWWSIQPRLSIGSGSYHNPDLDKAVDNASGTAVQGGCSAGYMFGRHIGIFSGLQFTSVAFSNTILDGFISNRFIQTSGYIEIPLYARIATARPGNIGFVGEAGITGGLLLTAELKLKARDITTGETTVQSTREKDGLNKGACSGFVFAGISIPLAYGIELVPGLDGQYYLTRFSDDPHQQEHLSRLGLRLGLNVQFNN